LTPEELQQIDLLKSQVHHDSYYAMEQYWFEVMMRFLVSNGYDIVSKRPPSPIDDKRVFEENLRTIVPDGQQSMTHVIDDTEYFIFRSRRKI